MFPARSNKPGLMEDSPGSDDLAGGAKPGFFFGSNDTEWPPCLRWGVFPKRLEGWIKRAAGESIGPGTALGVTFNQILARINDSQLRRRE